MIVITSLNTKPLYVRAGDTFNLIVRDGLGCEVVITEEITQDKIVDFVASFRFALEDGTCPGFHLTGVFACQAELPKELAEAKQLHELTPEQLAQFVRSVHTKLPS